MKSSFDWRHTVDSVISRSFSRWYTSAEKKKGVSHRLRKISRSVSVTTGGSWSKSPTRIS